MKEISTETIEINNNVELEQEKKTTTKKTKKTEVVNDPHNLDIINVPSLGPKSAESLKSGGITTAHQLMTTPLNDLEVLGITRTQAKKFRENILKLFSDVYADFVEEQSLEDIEGIGPTTAKSLREKGMNIYLLETTPIRELEEKYGITSNSAIKYQTAIAESKGGWFTDAHTFMQQQLKSDCFTFGVESLDLLFSIPEMNSSGIRAGESYEFFGSFRSGKSQLCHQLCVTVQLPREKGGLGKKAIYVDTEGTFSPSRLTQMAQRIKEEKEWDKPVEHILKDIMYARAKTSDMQMGITHKLTEILGNHKDEYALLIIDSVSAHFRAEYSGRGTLAERQQLLNYHLSILHRIADTYGLAVIVTNQVQANPAQFFGDPTQAVGGNIMGHWATHRCYLRKSKGEKRVIKIFDSPSIGELEAVFEIRETGVVSSESD
ncbi:MAG: DNA repair and recombination protein RadA [Candidatus Heimdallarchaeota archaeon]|nr:DNA repair and recombination protein RadA [Candidatus Heimdallarchaeota archaeon]